eukprot:1056252-Prymnesium_polylepis.3
MFPSAPPATLSTTPPFEKRAEPYAHKHKQRKKAAYTSCNARISCLSNYAETQTCKEPPASAADGFRMTDLSEVPEALRPSCSLQRACSTTF